jgi:hypothetical protein
MIRPPTARRIRHHLVLSFDFLSPGSGTSSRN